MDEKIKKSVQGGIYEITHRAHFTFGKPDFDLWDYMVR